MTGRGHRWTGIGTAFFAAAAARWLGLPELPTAVVAAVSTTIPDWTEIPFYRQGQRVGSLITHRTITHWPWLWLALAVWGVHTGNLIGGMALGAAIGAFAHIIGDAPNPMGIPWILPHKRHRIGKRGLWRSGQHEFLIVLAFAAGGYGTWRIAGGTFPFY